MKKFHVIKSFKGSPNGWDIVEYEAGNEYELTESLAAAALSEGWAEEIGEEKTPVKATKAKKGAPENK